MSALLCLVSLVLNPFGGYCSIPIPEPEHVVVKAEVVQAPDPVDLAADAVGWCESRDDYRAKNPVSSASGRYQFIDTTWTWVTGLEPPASAHPPAVQDEAFRDLWDDGRGASHWAASRSCWEPLLRNQ